jgi:hypothetical protein
MSNESHQHERFPGYAVGDKVTAKLHDGRKVDATVRAVFQQDGETKMNIDFGHEETATIELWQVQN